MENEALGETEDLTSKVQGKISKSKPHRKTRV